MAELVDALVSGTSILLDVQVRVLFWAQKGLIISAFFIVIPELIHEYQLEGSLEIFVDKRNPEKTPWHGTVAA